MSGLFLKFDYHKLSEDRNKIDWDYGRSRQMFASELKPKIYRKKCKGETALHHSLENWTTGNSLTDKLEFYGRYRCRTY